MREGTQTSMQCTKQTASRDTVRKSMVMRGAETAQREGLITRNPLGRCTQACDARSTAVATFLRTTKCPFLRVPLK